jgi:hypothetical protein
LSETLAGLMNMRLWGLRRDSMISTATIVSLARAAGFTTVLLIARKP